MKRVIGNRLFMVTFLADLLSNFGDVLYYLALMNYVLQLPQAKLAISLVSLSESLPLLTRLLMGILGDQTRNKIDTILATQVFRGVLYLGMGILMGFKPALWVLIVAVVVNFLSDLSGQYENALYIPLSLRIVPEEDREAMFAFRQGTSSAFGMLFQTSSALLIGLLSYRNLAFINAGTFLVSSLLMIGIRSSLKALVKKRPLTLSDSGNLKGKGMPAQILQRLQSSYRLLDRVPFLKSSIVTIVILNALLASFDALLMLSMKEDARFRVFNPATTLAIFSMLTTLGTIIGSAVTTTLAKRISLEKLLVMTTFSPFFIFMGFYLISFPRCKMKCNKKDMFV
ncbi:MFS transporter [Streptococcus ictaluri]